MEPSSLISIYRERSGCKSDTRILATMWSAVGLLGILLVHVYARSPPIWPLPPPPPGWKTDIKPPVFPPDIVIEPPVFPFPPDEPNLMEICPQFMCPVPIPAACRIPTFVIGLDGKTPCPVCDRNVCDELACPAIDCPGFADIPEGCYEDQNVIGSDGITICPVCPINKCVNEETWGKRNSRRRGL